MSERPEPDPLSSIVALLRPRTVLSKVVTGAGRWAVRYESYGHPSFCLVLAGSCCMIIGGAPALSLSTGDFVLLPATPGFTLASDLAALDDPSPRSPAPEVRELRHGDPSAEASLRLMGGYFLFDPTNAPLLLGLLPGVVHIEATDSGADRLAGIARSIGDEASADRPGREPILVRLAEILLIEALRWRPADESLPLSGLLAGLSDARLAKALRQLHEDVARRWTVEGLARAAGMSRAAFAAAFTQTLGMPPMDYLLRWRMALAKDLLRNRDLPLAELAAAIGYQSASAFSTAFSRCVGQPPSAFARAGRTGAAPPG